MGMRKMCQICGWFVGCVWSTIKVKKLSNLFSYFWFIFDYLCNWKVKNSLSLLPNGNILSKNFQLHIFICEYKKPIKTIYWYLSTTTKIPYFFLYGRNTHHHFKFIETIWNTNEASMSKRIKVFNTDWWPFENSITQNCNNLHFKWKYWKNNQLHWSDLHILRLQENINYSAQRLKKFQQIFFKLYILDVLWHIFIFYTLI